MAVINTGWNFELDVFTIDRNVFRATENSFFKINCRRSAHIATATGTTKTATKTKHGAKNIVETAAAKVEIE